jgi:hypothetical protein
VYESSIYFRLPKHTRGKNRERKLMHTLENYLVVLCTDFDMDTTPLALSCN